MRFERRSDSLDIAGQTVTVYELSAAEFQQVQLIEDETEQVIELVRLSLNGSASSEDILSWPNSILNQISSLVMSVNGLIEQGN